MLSCVVIEIQVLGKHFNNNTTCIFSMSSSLCVNGGRLFLNYILVIFLNSILMFKGVISKIFKG